MVEVQATALRGVPVRVENLSASLPSSHPPVLMTLIDTEEERVWGRDYGRDCTSVQAMRHIGRAQRLFEEFGIVPTYVADYPVASQREGYGPLLDAVRTGKAIVGAHLHPWVNPPYAEELCRRNTFPGNLDPAMETGKIRALADRIEASFGERPTIYKAGRYGIGPNTPGILFREGFLVDCSPSPPFDFSHEGGPDFRHCSLAPRWQERGRILSVPTTGGFVGALRRWGVEAYAATASATARRLRARGILSRLGLLNRTRLSPEGFCLSELKTLTHTLLDDGVRVLTFSFHSPTLAPGGSPYAQTEPQVGEFLDCCRRYFEFFLGEMRGVSMTPLEFRHLLVAQHSPAVPHRKAASA